jgi:hypothetical protein
MNKSNSTSSESTVIVDGLISNHSSSECDRERESKAEGSSNLIVKFSMDSILKETMPHHPSSSSQFIGPQKEEDLMASPPSIPTAKNSLAAAAIMAAAAAAAAATANLKAEDINKEQSYELQGLLKDYYQKLIQNNINLNCKIIFKINKAKIYFLKD